MVREAEGPAGGRNPAGQMCILSENAEENGGFLQERNRSVRPVPLLRTGVLKRGQKALRARGNGGLWSGIIWMGRQPEKEKSSCIPGYAVLQ